MSSWSSFTAFAKSALYNAQKKIDLVLDIQDDSDSDSKPYDVVELAKSGDDESSNWIASRMAIDAKSHTLTAGPVSSSGSPPCSTDSGDEASTFACVEYDVHSCVNSLISEVCSRVEPTTMTKDDYCSDPLANAGSAFSSYVYIQGGCSSTASSKYRKRETASKGNGGSVCTSPTEEADTATTSSDIEVIGTSIEDYCSDNGNGNGNEARLAYLSDLNGKQGSCALFRLSLQKRHPNELKSQNDAHLNEMLHIYEKVSEEKIAELTDKLAAEDSTNSALNDVNSRLIKENEKLKSLLQYARENENRIEQLLEEGERLSKKELQQSNIIKLLRQKEKESNNTIAKMSVAVNELESLKKVLKNKENLTDEQQEQIKNLQKKLQQQDVVVGKLQSKIEEYEATCNSFEAKMKAIDLADVTALKVASEFEVQKLKELTVQNKETELREKLQLQERHSSQEKAALLKQIDHMTAQNKEIREESLRRESALKWENSQLQQKLQNFETFKQDMSESVAVASRPLFDQIYDLQATIATQRNQWESLERALNEKISKNKSVANCWYICLIFYCNFASVSSGEHGEKKLGEALGKVGQLEMAASAMKSQLKHVEHELQATLEEKDQLGADLQIAKQQLSTFSQNQEKLDEMLMQEKRHSLPVEIADVEKMLNEKCEHLEAEYRKTIQQLEDQLTESKLKNENLEFELGELKHSSAVCTSQREYGILAVADDENNVQRQNENFTTNENRASFSMCEQVSFSEKLCDKLQLKENELALVKNELRQLQIGRERLAAEVIRLTNSVNELQAKLNANSELNVVHQDLNEKHQALLQMYGEKVEENESLLQELQEVKLMFRLQLEKLLNSNDSFAISGDASPSLP
ncbi:TATA element modulatory factor [Trichinella papuae]|uniref:TATA element modulatory factor n=1 Tax=Trichinella papuae TaxID=268474 RepID=A0A0V1MVY3_9BILA|nr:TATA element modulatory factor [Trichinella papuae]